MAPEKSQKIAYEEVLRPPLWLLAFVFFLLASFALSIWAAFDNQAGLIALGLSVIAVYAIGKSVVMKIQIQDGELRIGRAHIELKYLGHAKELGVDEMRLTRGRDADPAAFLALRFWQPRGVKIDVRDDRDPTPYWLVSTRHSKSLVEALKSNS